MNTPKLISPVSTAIGNIDPSRSGKAGLANGLDFALLLGEKRSEVAAPAPRQSSQPVQSRGEGNQSRSNSAPARESGQRVASSSSSAAQGQGTQAASRSNERNTAQTESSTPSAAAGAQSRNVAESGAPVETGKAASSGENVAANGQAKEESVTSAEGSLAQGAHVLAQEVAESGLPGVAVLAQAVVNATAGGSAGVESATPAAAVALQPQLATMALESEAELPTQQRFAAYITGAAPAANQAVLAAATAVSTENLNLPAGNLATLAEEAALRPAHILGLEPGAPAVTTVNGAAGELSSVASATPLALPVQPEAGPTAAALSLQLEEFNAMVAEARATSGTSLQPLATSVQPAFTQPAGLPLAGLAPVGPASGFPAGAPVTGSINAPLSSPQWPNELGRQFISISQAAKGLGQVAELRLDPPDLGPLRITINLSDNVAHAVFSSPHAIVRQTVENALPQLQQMLEQAGISLGQANVNDQHQSGQASEGFANGNTGNTRGAGANVAAGTAENADIRQNRSVDPNSLVDTFA